jgi:hypothetical protein
MPMITREYYEANKEKMDRNYLIRRVERWKTSDCAIHWDYCNSGPSLSSDCPVQLEQDEIDLLMMGAKQDRLA